MPITGEDALRIVQYALGGAAQGRASTSNEIQIANDAGRWMVGARDWQWASGTRATLGFTATESFIELPADFQAFIGQPCQSDGLIGGFEWTSLETLVELITLNPTAVGGYYYGALAWDQSEDGEPVQIIELHPTPTETVADALTIFYRRAWTDYPAPADATVAKIPSFMDGVYVGVLEAFARGWEDGITHPAVRQEYLAALMAGVEWATAVRRDAMAQPQFGHIKNGILSGRSRLWTRTEGVAGPT